SELVARAFSGGRARKALGTYNFAGDIGKMAVPLAASLLLVVLAWRETLAVLGTIGLIAAAAIFLLSPRFAPLPPAVPPPSAHQGARRMRSAFPLLLSIGVLDRATRMPFLTFLPFILPAKGASLRTIGIALTLVFAGGAVGKLACTYIGARFGRVATVWLTEVVTAAGIVALLLLPLGTTLALLPV